MHEGIKEEPVSAWLAAHVEGAAPPFAFEFIAGGHSNLTFKVTDNTGRTLVLRRPPLHHVLPTAHDMSREYKVITALGPTPVPVPRTYGLCTDETVNGSSFYVMDFVEGVVLHDTSAALSFDEAQRRTIGESFIDALADLHAVDIDAVGLSDFGRRDGYVERQLKRWRSQWEQSKTRDLPVVEDVHDRLAARIPEQGRAAIVHGDYRLGNTITGADARIAAILDWEICTLGDPLADVGYVLSSWADRGGSGTNAAGSPTVVGGFPSRDEITERYAARSGRDLSDIGFYIAFAMWKLACITEGVYARYLGGARGDSGVDFSPFAQTVERLAYMADETLQKVAR